MAYIKARRRQPRPKKFERRQTSASRNFLCRKQAESVFPLKCGTIEAYLPEGYRSRKRDKLIRLLATEGFLGQRNFGLGHHFHEISKAELEPEIPAYAEDGDLLVEMGPLKRSSMLSIRVRFLQKRVHSKYASFLLFAPELADPPRGLKLVLSKG